MRTGYDKTPCAPLDQLAGLRSSNHDALAKLFDEGALPAASSAALASMLLGWHTSPTEAAQRAERMMRVQEALNSLDPIDRKVLVLRHFEQLGRAEAAQVLGITPETGAKRYFRALKQLKDLLATLPGGGEAL